MITRFRRPLRRAFVAPALIVALLATAGSAATASDRRNLGDLSIEELMNETVTSVSKREQRLTDAASAIAVLTNDDIARSGFTSVADALRLVPGVNVGALNSGQWAISARGFNSLYSTKLLVLVDGRAVYSPLFSGVFWGLQQPLLEDLDRIEVIRGPGATVWGANAVNGVINIVSESARDTQGTLLHTAVGDIEDVAAGFRYGGKVGENTFYRVFVRHRRIESFPTANTAAPDAEWEMWHGGFRLDHHPADGTQFTWQADATGTEPVRLRGRTESNVNTLARWKRQASDRASTEIQAYLDRTALDDPARADVRTDTADLSFTQTLGLGERHNLIAGAGLRYRANRIAQTTPAVMIRDTASNDTRVEVFIQDEVALAPDRLSLTFGSKFEHNDMTGFEVQPSVRITYKPAETQTVWAALSRAIRTPNEIEGGNIFVPIVGAPFAGPAGATLPVAVGNPDISSEVFQSVELGYRIQPRPFLTVDVAAFYNRYRDLIFPRDIARIVTTAQGNLAELPWGNHGTATTYGGELSATIAGDRSWRLTGSYALLVTEVRTPLINNQVPINDFTAPRHQATLVLAYDPAPHVRLNLQLRHVAAIPAVPAYTTGDMIVSYQLGPRAEITVSGQNLFEPSHREVSDGLFAGTAEVPRSFYLKATWRY